MNAAECEELVHRAGIVFNWIIDAAELHLTLDHALELRDELVESGDDLPRELAVSVARSLNRLREGWPRADKAMRAVHFPLEAEVVKAGLPSVKLGETTYISGIDAAFDWFTRSFVTFPPSVFGRGPVDPDELAEGWWGLSGYRFVQLDVDAMRARVTKELHVLGLRAREVQLTVVDPCRRVLVPTPLQKSILKALDGQALKKEPLAEQCKVDPRTLYKQGGIKELMAEGLVCTKPRVGYFRPDAPPEDAIDLGLPPDGHQQGTN